ncbi:MAG: hypothetical protein M3R68_05090 [Acidobacteriota bacterium]|nr:hypothetical protein [Acidobacteriota bacterium]
MARKASQEKVERRRKTSASRNGKQTKKPSTRIAISYLRAGNRPDYPPWVAQPLWKALMLTGVYWVKAKLQTSDSRTSKQPSPMKGRKRPVMPSDEAGNSPARALAHHLWIPLVMMGVHWIGLKLQVPGYLDGILIVLALQQFGMSGRH